MNVRPFKALKRLTRNTAPGRMLLDLIAAGIALILSGHYASERFAVEFLAQVLAEEFSSVDRDTLEIWPSRRERDPIRRA